MQLAALHFLFTLLYFFNLTGWTRLLLAIFLFVNPLTLYLCNTINSDALFASLSLFWVGQLLWIIKKPRVYQLFVQAFLLFACFTIRNNAYYYPLIAIVAFVLSKQDLKWKLSGISMSFLLIIPFVIHTRNEAYKTTGTRQFSLFTGWQLANNALYIYDQIEVDSMDLPTREARDLNRYAIQYFRRIKPEPFREALEEYVGNFFIRQPEAPLKQYYGSHYIFKDEKANIVNWAKASAVFEPFGKSIILQHPIAYTQYFVLPNVKHYFIPPLSHIGLYNYGIDEIDPRAQAWFHYKTNKIHCFSHSFQGSLLLLYIGLFLLLNVYYLWNIARYAIQGGLKDYRNIEGGSQLLILSFLVINFLFSIVSTANILRYQYIPMIVLLGFSLVLQHFLEKSAQQQSAKRPFKKYNLT
jgi:hypothetical protein